MWLATKQEVERHQDRAGEVRSGMSSERCVVKTLVLRWATDLVFQEPWGHIILTALMALSPSWHITPTVWAGVCLYSPRFLPCQPCAYLRESIPRLMQRRRQGSQLNREKQETASLIPSSCSIPRWMRPVGSYRGSLGVALTFPLGYISSHQRKHLCSFCP